MNDHKYNALYYLFAVILISGSLFLYHNNTNNTNSISGNAINALNPQCGNKVLDTGEECDSGIIKGYSKIYYNCSDGKRYSTKGGCYYPNYLRDYAVKVCNSKRNSTGHLVSYEFADECAIRTPVYCFQQSSAFLNKNSFIKCNYNNCTLNFGLCNPTGTCGNGILEPGEKCDGQTGILCRTFNRSSVNPAAVLGCTSTCDFNASICNQVNTTTRCGNAVKESGEDCDDGNNITGDGCKNTCKFDCTRDSDCGKENCLLNFTIQKQCIDHRCQLTRNCTADTYCYDYDGGYGTANFGTTGNLEYGISTNGTWLTYNFTDICFITNESMPTGISDDIDLSFYTNRQVANCTGSNCHLLELGCLKAPWYGFANVDYLVDHPTTCFNSSNGGCYHGACINSSSTCGNGILDDGEDCDYANRSRKPLEVYDIINLQSDNLNSNWIISLCGTYGAICDWEGSLQHNLYNDYGENKPGYLLISPVSQNIQDENDAQILTLTYNNNKTLKIYLPQLEQKDTPACGDCAPLFWITEDGSSYYESDGESGIAGNELTANESIEGNYLARSSSSTSVCSEHESFAPWANPTGTVTCSNCQWNLTACSQSQSECGNGIVEVGELCDDGNLYDSDYCSSTCTCSDSDGGLNYPTIGTLTNLYMTIYGNITGPGGTSDDFCHYNNLSGINAIVLWEGICQGTERVRYTYDCSLNNMICQDGACVNVTSVCDTNSHESEKVTCIFNGSLTTQTCYRLPQRGGCEGVSNCSANPIGALNGCTIEWNSTCSRSPHRYTTMDGQDETIVFDCNPITTINSSSRTYNISIINMTFSPIYLQVNIGDTVVWTNNDTMSHTITSSDSGLQLNSSAITRGNSYSHKFTGPGMYRYHCNFHPLMVGRVDVS